MIAYDVAYLRFGLLPRTLRVYALTHDGAERVARNVLGRLNPILATRSNYTARPYFSQFN